MSFTDTTTGTEAPAGLLDASGNPLTPDPLAGPTVSGGDTDLAPPDDFGREVMAVFERRTAATIAASGDDGAPPGGWPSRDDTTPTVVGGDTAPAAPADDTPAAPAATEDTGEAVDAAAVPAADDTGAVPVDVGQPEIEAAGAALSGEIDTDTSAAETIAVPLTPAAGYTWTYEGPDGTSSDATFTDAEVQQALSLAAWAENLPAEARTQIAAIEQGSAVAVSRAELDEFQAWRNQRDTATAAADDLSRLGLDADDPAAREILRLRAEVAANTAAAPATLPPAQQATLNANLDETARRFEAGVASYAVARGLTQLEAESLLQSAVEANVIPAFIQQNTAVNPVTGTPLSAPNIEAAATQALDFALVRNPALHSRVLANQPANGAGAPASVPATGTSARPPADVTSKRAKAASLASAPSAAAAPVPRDLAKRTPQETVADMARDIEAAMARS